MHEKHGNAGQASASGGGWGPEEGLVKVRSDSEKECLLSKAGEDHPGCHLVPLLGRCRESHRCPKKMEMREGWVRMRNTGSLSDPLAQGD